MTETFLLAQEGAVAGLAGAMIIFWIIGLALTVFWIWMLVDCLTSAMPTNEKILWAVVIVLTHALGALIYFFVKRGNRHRAAVS